MVDRVLTQEEQKEILTMLAYTTAIVARFTTLTDPVSCLTLRGMSTRASELMIDFESDELVRARLRKEMAEATKNCKCAACQASKKLDS